MISNSLVFPDAPGTGTAAAEITLDLAALAQISRGERIEVEPAPDRTLELFEQTLRLIDDPSSRATDNEDCGITVSPNRFIPENVDLRERFLFAEAIGSYAALNELLDSRTAERQIEMSKNPSPISKRQRLADISALERYRQQIHEALIHANGYLSAANADSFSAEQLYELNLILREAQNRIESIDAVLGAHLIREIELGVHQLYEFQENIRTVQRSVEGVFLVGQDVLFMPTNDLIDIVNNLFKAVGNAYVAEHIDGVLLLAARNLLIQAVSFYSYYGKQQIYTAFARKKGHSSRASLTHHIRGEIRKLFRACMTDNKLILRGVMSDAEREFEISVEAIRAAAERTAVEAVRALIPDTRRPAPKIKRSLLKRLSHWLFR